jgi:hypothetical protein
MSDYKPETLPGGVLIRKIKDEEGKFVLSSMGQALIVTNLDIASMYGLAYPEEQVDTVKAWDDVSQKLLESEPKQSAAISADVSDIDVGDKYRQRVQKVAEKMANQFNINREDAVKLRWIHLYDEAVLAVVEAENGVREALKNYGAGGRWIDQYLIENGYMPAREVKIIHKNEQK